jgi:hypothetical protein
MATSAEAISFIKSNFKVEDLGDNLLKMLWTFTETNRSQLLFVEVRDSVLLVLSPFAGAGQVSADKALEISESIFGIVKRADQLFLTHVVLLENADANEIAAPLELVAVHADDLEEALGLGDDR